MITTRSHCLPFLKGNTDWDSALRYKQVITQEHFYDIFIINAHSWLCCMVDFEHSCRLYVDNYSYMLNCTYALQ